MLYIELTGAVITTTVMPSLLASSSKVFRNPGPESARILNGLPQRTTLWFWGLPALQICSWLCKSGKIRSSRCTWSSNYLHLFQRSLSVAGWVMWSVRIISPLADFGIKTSPPFLTMSLLPSLNSHIPSLGIESWMSLNSHCSGMFLYSVLFSIWLNISTYSRSIPAWMPSWMTRGSSASSCFL